MRLKREWLSCSSKPQTIGVLFSPRHQPQYSNPPHMDPGWCAIYTQLAYPFAQCNLTIRFALYAFRFSLFVYKSSQPASNNTKENRRKRTYIQITGCINTLCHRYLISIRPYRMSRGEGGFWLTTSPPVITLSVRSHFRHQGQVTRERIDRFAVRTPLLVGVRKNIVIILSHICCFTLYDRS